MTEGSPIGMYRIGGPPTAPPPPRTRERRRTYVLLAGLAVLVLAVGAATAGILAARGDAQAGAAPSSSPSTAPLSERSACVVLVPLLTDGLDELTAVFEDPSRDTADLAAITAQLRALEPITPTAWRADLVAVDTVLQMVADADGDPGRIVAAAGDSDAWSDAGLRLAAQCRPYATS